MKGSYVRIARKYAALLITFIVGLSSVSASAQQLPSTISGEAAAAIRAVVAVRRRIPKLPAPKSMSDWDALHAAAEGWSIPAGRAVLDRLRPTVTQMNLAGTPVFKVTPRGAKKSRRILIYVHGGGYTLFSARSTLANAAMMADAAGLSVYSIDYTVAPRGRWQQVTDQVLTVYKALLASGHAPRRIGMFGDSAGGSLVAGSVLKMRDRKIPLPGALVLQSPWSDITATGDSYETLKGYDAILNWDDLKSSADAYADPADQKNPYVSPVYGDYSKPFPPTLIQGGTREIFLSNFVRHYDAI